jgi:hypothetical protein
MIRCRHERNSWIILGGMVEWCYVCGAYRLLRLLDHSTSTPRSRWIKPSGDPKRNPTAQIEGNRHLLQEPGTTP